MTAPIALFVYNRPSHTRRTVEALRANRLALETDLFIYSDAPKSEAATPSVDEIRQLIKTIDGFNSITIIERETNLGVDASIIDGVTTLCARFGSVIVIEDDIVTASWFLHYINEALDRFAADERVMQVGGFIFPLEGFPEGRASFLPNTSSWGWATWKRAWDHLDPHCNGYEELKRDWQKRNVFNQNGAYDHFSLLHAYMEGRTKAWDIQWYLTVFMRRGLTLYPNNSLVRNIGMDGTGEHCDATTISGDRIHDSRITQFASVEIDRVLQHAIEKFLHTQQGHTSWYFFRYVWLRGIKKRLLGEVI